MAHTALQKAIQQQSEYRDTYNPMCDEFTLIDKCVEQLTDLLPYERETIEAAHKDWRFNSAKDYFTKTYNQ